jgi:hypothetical protein
MGKCDVYGQICNLWANALIMGKCAIMDKCAIFGYLNVLLLDEFVTFKLMRYL